MRIYGPMVALGEVCYWFKSVFRGTWHQSKNTIGTTETILSYRKLYYLIRISLALPMDSMDFGCSFLLIEAIIWLGGFFLYSIGVDLSSPYRMFITLVVSYSFILTAKLEIPYSFLDSAYTRGFFLYWTESTKTSAAMTNTVSYCSWVCIRCLVS